MCVFNYLSKNCLSSSLAPVVAIIPPPPDIQPVIDKLAQYVARNGIKFETSVLAKNDSRLVVVFLYLHKTFVNNLFMKVLLVCFLSKTEL